MMRNTYLIIIAILIVTIIVLILTHMLFVNLFHANYLSGNWMDSSGSIVIIDYNGFFSESKVVFGLENDDTYDTINKEGKIYINPFATINKFVAYSDDYKFEFNIIEGTLNITRKSDKKNYGKFYRNSLGL